jgi:hypothetical protein
MAMISFRTLIVTGETPVLLRKENLFARRGELALLLLLA